MKTLTVEITNDEALTVLQDLHEKHFINIITKPDLNSTVFPGEPLTTEEFKELIINRESGSSMSLNEAKTKWAGKKKQLLKLAK